MKRTSRRRYLLGRSLQLIISGWSVYVGIAVGLTSAVPAIRLTTTLDSGIPPLLSVFIALFLVVGNVAVIRGVLSRHKSLHEGWRTEQGGLIISGTGWLAYSVAVAWTKPAATTIWVLGALIALAAWLRIVDQRDRMTRAWRNLAKSEEAREDLLDLHGRDQLDPDAEEGQ